MTNEVGPAKHKANHGEDPPLGCRRPNGGMRVPDISLRCLFVPRGGSSPDASGTVSGIAAQYGGLGRIGTCRNCFVVFVNLLG